MKRIVSILLLAFLCRSFLYAAVEEKAITKRLDEELASQGKKIRVLEFRCYISDISPAFLPR